MTSFGWKRKAGVHVNKSASSAFETQSKDESADLDDVEDWISLAPKRRVVSLEDAVHKSERLKTEGSVLAESERYWEAIKKWDEALQLNPVNSKVYEMKAQALMALNELYPAVAAAQKAVQISPTWWVAQQTLGRAQLNLGEVRLALRCFATAVHLNPSDRELWEEDLLWAHSLLTQRRKAQEAEEEVVNKSNLTITELSEDEDSASVDTTECSSMDNVIAQPSVSSLEVWTGDDASKVKKTKKLKNLPQNYVVMRDK